MIIDREEILEMDRRLQASIPPGYVIIPAIRFDFEGYLALATQLGIQDPVARLDFARNAFNKMVAMISELQAGDFIVLGMAASPQEGNER